MASHTLNVATRPQISDRRWPITATPWMMAQTWNTLLFAHWPVSTDVLRPMIPKDVEVDTFNRQAWISMVAFRLNGIRLRGTIPVPLTSSFPELNVRTYVTVNGKPGVWFISLDADNVLGIATARRFFHLPYLKASIGLRVHSDNSGNIEFSSHRTQRGAADAEFAAHYRPKSPIFHTQPGTLEHWLTERYRYYVMDRQERLYSGEVEHDPWPLQEAQADITTNTMALATGIPLPAEPSLLHYAHKINARFHFLRSVERLD